LATAKAQTQPATAKVTGQLTDAQGKPMEFATVSLLNVTDSSLIKGTLTTDTGTYIFDHIAAGTYIIKATAVGYVKTFSAPFNVLTNDVKVPDLKMPGDSKILNTVEISAAKPLIERKIDRTVMNVSNSILAAGNTAMEILARAPGVTVDRDDNISLKGKQGVTVMINDKLTYLSSAQLATLLTSMDGNTIESIEIISNPSAKYDASGNSGIINIKLKKNSNSGTNGNVTLGAAMGYYFRSNESITLNHKEGALNVFGNFSHTDGQFNSLTQIDRVVTGPNGEKTYFHQGTSRPQIKHLNNYRIGADYDLSDKNTIGFMVNGYFHYAPYFTYTPTRIGSTPAAADSSQLTTSTIRQTFNDFAINLNDRYEITKGQVLSADLDYSKFSNNSNAQYQTDYSPFRPSTLLRNQTPSNIDIRAVKVDYTNSISKTMKLEAGVKFSDVKTDNDLEAQLLNSSGMYINDTSRTNRFIYNEKISAGYINFSKEYKNTSVQAGLRGEYTNSSGNLVTTNNLVNRSYFNLFPSLFIHHHFSEKHELGFSYSRRIDRPGYGDLNPFIYYLDAYTYDIGNAFLKPQYTNSFELNYDYNKTIIASLGYSHISDPITKVILTDPVKKTTYGTHVNLTTRNSYNIEVNLPYTMAKWFTGNIDLLGFYSQFVGNDILGANYNRGMVTYVTRITENLNFLGYRAELLENYHSKFIGDLSEVKPEFNLDLGVSRSFADKKLNVKFSVSDVFNTLKENLYLSYQADQLQIYDKNDTRVMRLTLTYNFGNSKIKARDHQSGMEDEKGRVQGGN
jgi:hypothetical protein